MEFNATLKAAAANFQIFKSQKNPPFSGFFCEISVISIPKDRVPY
jgi:hypothetical protein